MNIVSSLPFFKALSILAVALISWSCSGPADGNQAVPKPEAWPRIEIPAEEYSIRTFNDTAIPFNTSANVDSQNKDGGIWIDVTYPTFANARLYLTLLPVTDRQELTEAIENRRERMELNTGGAVTELTELTSDGDWEGLLAVTRSSLTTPVQLLAHDGRHLLSGALYFNFPPETSADSVAPIVRTVRRDMLHALKHITTIK